MQRYGNAGGDSGIRAFECGTDSITVEFSDGAVYRYTYRSAGAGVIEQMKQLALRGSGLNGYINRHAKNAYESRLR
ncbi:hypothetical protein [Geothrix mesophila]|uniref:hypothetical protein n=1 Tax=Geothrix mesophila TaxID=2922723 RepID=UPI001FAB3E73|nr:hypothetical protein [Geothrix sp. SG198]